MSAPTRNWVPAGRLAWYQSRPAYILAWLYESNGWSRRLADGRTLCVDAPERDYRWEAQTLAVEAYIVGGPCTRFRITHCFGLAAGLRRALRRLGLPAWKSGEANWLAINFGADALAGVAEQARLFEEGRAWLKGAEVAARKAVTK